MSFTPISTPRTAEALYGIGTAAQLDTSLSFKKSDRRFHGPSETKLPNISVVLMVIVSAIIFIMMVAIYDVFKSAITNDMSKRALIDPMSNNTQQDINRTLIANNYSLMADIMFAVITVISFIVFVPLLIYIIV